MDTHQTVFQENSSIQEFAGAEGNVSLGYKNKVLHFLRQSNISEGLGPFGVQVKTGMRLVKFPIPSESTKHGYSAKDVRTFGE